MTPIFLFESAPHQVIFCVILNQTDTRKKYEILKYYKHYKAQFPSFYTQTMSDPREIIIIFFMDQTTIEIP